MNLVNFDWNELAFGSKKAVNELHAIFIAAPRDISPARFTQLVKEYLPMGNILVGAAKEPYIDGFEGQPQFTTLRIEAVQKIIDKVNGASKAHKIYTIAYFQRDAEFVLDKIHMRRVVLVNGSWHRSFHLRPEYYTLVNRGVPFDKVSPFSSDAEARAYAAAFAPPEAAPGIYSAEQMLDLAQYVAKGSFDFSTQIGVALGRKKDSAYQLLAATYNAVVPYQTYGLHYGPARERHFSPANDLNHYDTVHAEVELIIKAQKKKIDLRGTALFINVLPCPSCARMFTETDIAEFVYREDHSGGYGVKMLELAGKKVTRIVR